ncbi:hypothetical protein MT418_008363 [Batrachochytrium dendrobatidis]
MNPTQTLANLSTQMSAYCSNPPTSPNQNPLHNNHMAIPQDPIIATDPVVVQSIVPETMHFVNSANTADLHAEMCNLDIDAAFGNDLDKLTVLFRQAILADYTISRNRINEYHKAELNSIRQAHELELDGLNGKMDSVIKSRNHSDKKLVDYVQVVNAATAFLTRKRNRLATEKWFGRWKVRQMELRKRKFAMHIAPRHHRKTMMQKAILGWHSEAGVTWRKATENRIRMEAEKHMQTMSAEYESRIAQLSKKLNKTQMQLHLSIEKQHIQQEDMKRSFLRGVCALNMETMGIFRQDEMHCSESVQKQLNYPITNMTVECNQSSKPTVRFISDPAAVPDIACKTLAKETTDCISSRTRGLVTRHYN